MLHPVDRCRDASSWQFAVTFYCISRENHLISYALYIWDDSIDKKRSISSVCMNTWSLDFIFSCLVICLSIIRLTVLVELRRKCHSTYRSSISQTRTFSSRRSLFNMCVLFFADFRSAKVVSSSVSWSFWFLFLLSLSKGSDFLMCLMQSISTFFAFSTFFADFNFNVKEPHI